MKKLIQIGAGNIGRACIGRLFYNAGYQIYFSDIDQNLLTLLSEKKEYSVRLLDKDYDENSTNKMY